MKAIQTDNGQGEQLVLREVPRTEAELRMLLLQAGASPADVDHQVQRYDLARPTQAFLDRTVVVI